MPRFHLDQRVVITGPITTADRGHEAVIIGLRPNRHTPPGVTSADKYIVQFEDGRKAEFFEIQLAVAEEKRKGA